MLFKKDTPLYAYEVVREGGVDVLFINYLGASFIPNLADSPEVMAKTVDALIENPNISKIVFVQQRNYVYDAAEAFMLVEVAQIYNHLMKQEKILTPSRLILDCQQCLGNKYNNMAYFSFTLKRDPVLAYHELKKFWREERAVLEKTPPEFQVYELNYLRLLERIISLLEGTRLIREAIAEAETRKYATGREIYQKLFQPDIVPNFTFTRLVAGLPEDAEIVEQYEIASGPDKSVITILKRKGEPKYLYHILPPEYTLEEDYQMLLNLARNVMIEHQPKAEEFLDFERTRRVFSNIARDLIQDLANTNKIPLNYSQLEVLANILVRHTIGFGVIEVLLQDERLQDIALNAPIPLNPIFVRHGFYDECETNIIPSQEDAESWAAKFRMLSGRPLDEANPILDTELAIKNFRARVAIIQQPLSPNGLAYAFRRHREKPWTLPLFIDSKMINPFTAGLMSFFIEGARTLLVAGTRSAGKCVKGDTLIQLANGDIKAIKELEHGRQEKISDGYIFYPNPEINVLSLDTKGLKSNSKIVDAFWRRKSPEELIKLTTNSGKEIITTQEHPYFIFNDKFEAVNAGSLGPGRLIATPRSMDVQSEEVFIPEAKEIISQIRTNAKRINFPEEVNEELAEFLGYLIGDGHLDEHKLEFTNSNTALRKRFDEIAKKLFSVTTREIKDKNTWNVQITSRLLNRALNKLFEIPFGDKASSIRIPSKILKSKNEVLAAFLRAYFDCDGSVIKGSKGNEKREIEIATASSLMAKQLQMALLRFGIISFLRRKDVKGNKYYRIFIRGEFFKDYVEKIGFGHQDKAVRANKLVSREWTDNTNIDIIPNGNCILRELRKGLRVRPSEIRKATGKDYWAYENNEYNVSRKWFWVLVKAYEKRFKELANLKEKFIALDTKSNISDFEYFRRALNIKNEEFADGISLATVTNFFNEVYKPCTKTKELIIGKIKKIYEEAISEENKELLNQAMVLANSDIFWDRVRSVEKIKAEEEWVYDFTVEPFQNFIANGFFAHNTSLLGSLMLEIMPKYRIVTVEDTLEIPFDAIRALGYDIQRMKVRSALLKTSAEVAADEGIRTSLRLGDSCLIIGEVRSEEALALYESMRIGALANVVAGTIHGGSPYAVFDRVVNDLKVPITSFKATDLILVANPIKSPSGGRAFRRVTSLSEVRKEWKNDPLDERGFVDLLRYSVEKDELEPTADLINGDSETIKSIASGVKGWAGNWDAVYDNILLRGKVKEEIVKIAKETGYKELLEAKFNCLANAIFYEISEKVRQEIGLPLGERVFPEWQKTMKEEARKFIRKQ